MRVRPICAASMIVSAAALATCGLAVDWTIGDTDLRAVPLVRSAAIAMLVIAVLCWAMLALVKRDDRKRQELDGEYRRREAVLIKTVARISGGIPTPTQPLPHLRPVRRH